MNILLTGATRGLGLVIANHLISDGHTVFAIGRNLSDGLRELIEANEGKVHFLSYDLANYTDVQSKIFQDWIGDQPIHGFVNNAAFSYDTLITNIEVDPLLKMTFVNQITPIVMTKHVVRNMLIHEIKGSIVHITSISAHTGFKALSMYAATKGALEAFSKNIAREWGSKGVRSNCIAAGYMETDMTAIISEEDKQKIYKRVSLKKATDMDSVAASVLFLIGEGSNSMTGQVLHVDGGAI
jgi:3-oxoacyl-[acyl-carrier protein] reductase